jgi:hypothetical protein
VLGVQGRFTAFGVRFEDVVDVADPCAPAPVTPPRYKRILL